MSISEQLRLLVSYFYFVLSPHFDEKSSWIYARMHQINSKISKFSGEGFPYHTFLKESKFLQIFVAWFVPPTYFWLAPSLMSVKPDTGGPFVIVARILVKYLLERSIHRNGFNFFRFLQI